MITSILSNASEEILFKASLILVTFEGLPSIRIRTLSLPLKLTVPSVSTATEGTLLRTSLAVPPLTDMS